MWSRVTLEPLNRGVVDRAGAIRLACHPRVSLRTLDTLHIATRNLHQSGARSTTDARMRAACAPLAITLLPANTEALTAN